MTKHTIITGGTRGIGFGLAQAFLSHGCAVMISGRTQANTNAAVEKLKQGFPGADLLGQACDVRQPDQVQALWDAANQVWGQIDIWVNNAGISGEEAALWQLPTDELDAVIETNILGTLYGCQVAANGMLEQGNGAIYNMEGMGSDGRMHKGLTSYGTSKYAVSYISQALAKELEDTPILIGSLRPGMVVTGLITDRYINRPEEFDRVKRIFNIIAERVETVTPWLVERMLANTRTGVVISFSGRWKLMWRFLSAPFVKRELFDSSLTQDD